MSNSSSPTSNGKGQKSSKKRERKIRPFPRVPLVNAIRIPLVIKEHNAGNPWSPEEIAKAVGNVVTGGNFYYLTTGSRDYGLSKGHARGAKGTKIELTDLGNRLVYASSAEIEANAKVEAFLSVPIFRRVLEHYKGNNLPEMKYLGNTLVNEFEIDSDFHQEFVELFRKNCRYVGIGSTWLGGNDHHGSFGSNPILERAFVVPGENVGDLPLCFVIMPFVERDDTHPVGFFEEVLNSLIVPAAQQAGFEVRTANRQGSDVIQSTIVNDLLKADLVVADLTEHNPNVLFELGMRMREDKPVALIKARGTGRIFDVDNMLRVVEYDPNLWGSTVLIDRPKVTEHIQATWENRDSDISYMKLLNQTPAIIDVQHAY